MLFFSQDGNDFGENFSDLQFVMTEVCHKLLAVLLSCSVLTTWSNNIKNVYC